MSVITRFAPSPTGLMHIGNARTALFNYLIARKYQGQFLLRIEDTDSTRSQRQYRESLLTDLEALGLRWDSGPDQAGSYLQSQRMNLYANYYQQLMDRNLAYPCFCSEAALKIHRKQQLAVGQPPRYSGACARLSAAEVAARYRNGEVAALRLRMDAQAIMDFEDLVRGQQHFSGKDIGDFIIRRADGSPAFLFANAIDDALMGITQVWRGEDHLSNTPRQIHIMRLLDLKIPQYGHIALILGNDGAPLSKRNGSRSVREIREEGYLPIALVNYLARLGITLDSNELLSLDALAVAFDPGRMVKGAARFDAQQLKFYHKQAVQQSNEQRLRTWLKAQLTSVPNAQRDTFCRWLQPNLLFPQEAAEWAEVLYGTWDYDATARRVIMGAGVEFFTLLAEQLTAQAEWNTLLAALKSRSGRKGKALFLPLRMAFTGREHGPELSPLLTLIGYETLAQRAQHCARLATVGA